MNRFHTDYAVSLAARPIAMQPALMPLEAAMLPAKAKRPLGTLRMVKASFAPGNLSARRSASGRRNLRW